jgi:hypothetical protein
MNVVDLQTKLFEGETEFSNGELVSLLKHMALKIHKLENNFGQNSFVPRKYNKECALDWLNKNETEYCNIDKWSETIDFNQYLPMIFDNNLEVGTKMAIEKNLDSLPIKTSKQSRTDYYVFHNNKWVVWNSDKIHMFIKKCTLKFLHVFSLWSLNNRDQYINDDNKERVYLQRYNRVLGPDNMDPLCNNVRKFIYKQSFMHI